VAACSGQFDLNGFTAKVGGDFVDHWKKIR